jgi:hypothetical protein
VHAPGAPPDPPGDEEVVAAPPVTVAPGTDARLDRAPHATNAIETTGSTARTIFTAARYGSTLDAEKAPGYARWIQLSKASNACTSTS